MGDKRISALRINGNLRAVGVIRVRNAAIGIDGEVYRIAEIVYPAGELNRRLIEYSRLYYRLNYRLS